MKKEFSLPHPFFLNWSTPQLAVAMLLTGASALAFAPIFVRLSDAGPSATGFWRIGLALPILWLWAAKEQGSETAPRRPSTRTDYRRLVVTGIIFGLDLVVWHWALHFTSVANGTLLPNFAPVFVTLGAWLFFKQKVTSTFIVGLVLALAGATIVIGLSFSANPQHLLGDALGLLTAVFYGSYILAVKQLRNDFSPPVILGSVGAIACLILIAASLLSGEVFFPITALGWIAVIGLAMVSHIGGQGLITTALAHLPASFSSVSLLIQPVLAAFLAWIILNESIGVWQAIGGVVVLIGIFIARRGSA